MKDQFSVNDKFTNPHKKVKINQIQMLEKVSDVHLFARHVLTTSSLC